MNTATMLRHQAVNAAKTGDWKLAVTLNTQILSDSPTDTHALNRLGVAQLQLKQRDEALATFKQVLEIDKTNAIAKRHLDRMKDNQSSAAPSFTNQHYIDWQDDRYSTNFPSAKPVNSSSKNDIFP